MIFIIAFIAVVVLAWYTSLRLHPYAPCRWCRGRRGRSLLSTGKRWGDCGHCDGSGKRLRFGARVLDRRKGK